LDFEIRISEAALADLEEILAYSWAHFPESTERFGTAILDHIEVLKSFPYLGWTVRGRAGVRRLVHTPITIDYRVSEEMHIIEVLQLRHASRH
jgi:plasmid stabilization system protein ParE